MILKNIENNFLVKSSITNSLKSPFICLNDIFNCLNYDVTPIIDDIYKVNSTVFQNNTISQSFVINSLLKKDHYDNFLNINSKKNIYSFLEESIFYDRTFHRNNKKDAYNFCVSIINRYGSARFSIANNTECFVIYDISSFNDTWDYFVGKSRYIYISENNEGDYFKIYIKDENILKVYSNSSPYIIGDGDSTLKVLIDNLIEERNNNILYRDHEVCINKTLDLNFIPKKDEIVLLNDSISIGSGGIYIDVSNKVKGLFDHLVKKIHKTLTNDLFIEVTIVTKNITEGRYKVVDIKLSSDLRELLSCVFNKEDLTELIRYLVPYKTISLDPEYIIPSSYNNEKLKYITQAYLFKVEAYKLGLSIENIGRNTFKIINRNINKRHSVIFFRGMSHYTTIAARNISNNKSKTKLLLSENGINTPKGAIFSISKLGEAWDFADSLIKKDYKVVIKPSNAQGGNGVVTDIKTQPEFIKAWKYCKNLGYDFIIIEEQLDGDDHRIVVIQNKVIGASQRLPAFVIGDGKRSIRELIDIKNQERSRNIFFKDRLIKENDYMVHLLLNQNLSLDSIPKEGEKAMLSAIANAGAGGDIIDRSEDIHPDWIPLAVKIREVMVDAYHVGIDIMMQNISISPHDQKWAVLEVNTNPGFGIQIFPGVGKSRNIAETYLKNIFYSIVEYPKITYQLYFSVKGDIEKYLEWFKSICDYRSVVYYIEKLEENIDVNVIIIGYEESIKEVIYLCHKVVMKHFVVSSIRYKKIDNR